MAESTIILVHGQTCDRTFWQHIQPRLETPSLAIDLPSHGDAADLGEDGYAEFGRRVADAVEARGGSASLLGYSLGSLAVVEGLIELSHRGTLDRVDQVVLAGMVGDPDEAATELQRGYIAHIEEHGLDEAVVTAMATNCFDEAWLEKHDGAAALRTMQSRSSSERVLAIARALAARPTIVDRVPETVPDVTVLQFTRDKAAPIGAAVPLQRALKAVRVIDIEGPHMWPWQSPGEFSRIVNRVLAGDRG